jgi:hypothetical protein
MYDRVPSIPLYVPLSYLVLSPPAVNSNVNSNFYRQTGCFSFVRVQGNRGRLVQPRDKHQQNLHGFSSGLGLPRQRHGGAIDQPPSSTRAATTPS